MGYLWPIETQVQKARDLLRKDAGVAGPTQLLDQLTWMLFLRVVDDHEKTREATRPDYRSPIPPSLRWDRWPVASDELTHDRLLTFVEKELLPSLRSLQGDQPIAAAVRAVFQGAHNHVKQAYRLRFVHEYLTEAALGRSRSHLAAAEVYRQLLDELQGADGAIERHTPRALTDFMVQQVDPRPGERIVDPACGTGGFLVSALEHMRRHHQKSDADEPVLQESLHGFERRAMPYRLCVANLVLHGVERIDHIHHADALRSRDRVGPADVVFVHTPFGEPVDRRIEGAFPAPFRSRELADLYFYLVMEALRPGGRAAMVVPDGFLSGEGVRTRLKEKLLDECDLHTIVRLPKGVFIPHSGIKTVLFFFTKGKPTRKIWYYEHPCPPGSKGYTKTKRIRADHLDPERRWWENRTVTDQAWTVSIDEIKVRNNNLDASKPPPAGADAPSRLLELNLRNFRGFSSLSFRLPPEGPAVLIGENGAGKSTVLDAIAMLLSSFTALARGVPARQAEVAPTEGDIRVGAPNASVSATFRVGRGEQFWDIGLNRLRGAGAPGKEIVRQAEILRERIVRGAPASLPILCSYSVNRGLGDDGGPRRAPRTAGAMDAYDHAFRGGLGSFQDFLFWFRREEDLENQIRLRDDPEHRNPRLEVVRRALQGFLHALTAARFSDLRIERSEDAKEGALVMEKGETALRIEQLSEGERNTLLLVSDIARRLALANPGLEDPLEGEGIVLVDEIDLHLHPAWQRGILPALCNVFPGCQFIVSTHSAQVLSRIHRENVFIFEDFELVAVTPHTYGRDANSILGEAMGVPERPSDIEEKIRQASVLLDEERLEEARTALGELESILGKHDVEVVRLRTMLLFLEPPAKE